VRQDILIIAALLLFLQQICIKHLYQPKKRQLRWADMRLVCTRLFSLSIYTCLTVYHFDISSILGFFLFLPSNLSLPLSLLFYKFKLAEKGFSKKFHFYCSFLLLLIKAADYKKKSERRNKDWLRHTKQCLKARPPII